MSHDTGSVEFYYGVIRKLQSQLAAAVAENERLTAALAEAERERDEARAKLKTAEKSLVEICASMSPSTLIRSLEAGRVRTVGDVIRDYDSASPRSEPHSDRAAIAEIRAAMVATADDRCKEYERYAALVAGVKELQDWCIHQADAAYDSHEAVRLRYAANKLTALIPQEPDEHAQ